MTSLFDVGKSALNSYRQSLAVTGQNIANINTEGYKRREATLEEVTGSQGSVTSLANQTGLGVRVTDIKRSFDQYLLDRSRTAIASFEKLDTYVDQVRQLENMLLPEKGSLGEQIGSFFDALREVAAAPSELAPRAVALEQGKAMTAGFNTYALQLDELKSGIRAVMDDSVTSVNMLASQLADINARILSAGQSGQSPNSIYDLRDRVISDMAKLTDLTVDYADRGIATVKLGASGVGPVLVSGTDARQLGFDETFSGLQPVVIAAGERRTTNQVTAGMVAGLAEAFTTVNETMKDLDQLAMLMSREMNIQHRAGITLDGEAGSNMFSDNGLSLFTGPANRTDVAGEILITDPEKLPMGELVATYSSETDLWTIDGAGLDQPLKGARQIAGPGFVLSISGQGATGDTLILSPGEGAAATISFLLEKPQQLAASSDILVTAASHNQSDAGVSVDTVTVDSGAGLARLDQVFTNSSSPIEASEFFRDGFVAEIPAGTAAVSLSSLTRQAQTRFQLTALELGHLSSLDFRLTDIPETDALNRITAFDGPVATAVADGTYRVTQPQLSAYTGSGSGAVFDVVVSAGMASVTVIDGGAGFYEDDRLTIAGTVLGGTSPADDLEVTVGSIANPVTGPFSIDIRYQTAFPQAAADSVWPDTEALADMLNRGILKTAANESLQSLGLYASGAKGSLTITSAKGNFDISGNNAPRLTVGSGQLAGTVSDRIDASDLQIFTKEGRHIAGSALSAEDIASVMTAENGFGTQSVYNAAYLNQTDPAYRGMDISVTRAQGHHVLLAGSNGLSATAVAAVGRMPASAATDQMIAVQQQGGRRFDIELQGGASAADAAERLNAALQNTDIQARATMRVEFSDFTAAGDITFGLEGRNLEPIEITASVLPADLSNLASAINSQSNRTGITATLSTNKQRLILESADGSDIFLSDIARGTPAFLAKVVDTDGSPASASVTLAGSGSQNSDNARFSGMITMTSASAFSLTTEEQIKKDSQLDPTNGGFVTITGNASSDSKLVSFAVERDADSNEASRDGLRAVAAGADYQMAVLSPDEDISFTGRLSSAQISPLSKAAVNKAMVDAVRSDAVLASLSAGAPAARPQSVEFTFSGPATVDSVRDSLSVTIGGTTLNVNMADGDGQGTAVTTAQLLTEAVARAINAADVGVVATASAVTQGGVTSYKFTVTADQPGKSFTMGPVVFTDADSQATIDLSDSSLAQAMPLDGDAVYVDFAGDTYKIEKSEGEIVVSGGETGRLTAYFDQEQRLQIFAGGTLSGQQITLTGDNVVANNQSAAARFGLAQTVMRFAGQEIAPANNQAPLRFSYNGEAVEISMDASGNVRAQPALLPDGLSVDFVPATGGRGRLQVTYDSSLGAVSFDHPQHTMGMKLAGSDLRLTDTGIRVTSVTGDVQQVSASADSLAKQKIEISDLVVEDLLVFVTGGGAKTVSSLYDIPELRGDEQQELLLGDNGLALRALSDDGTHVEIIDKATGHSLATRVLDADNSTTFNQYKFTLKGVAANGDEFLIEETTGATGDNRNLLQLIDQQSKDMNGAHSGGFSEIFAGIIAGVGASVRASDEALSGAEATKEAAVEAEAEFSGVNLDSEAAALIEFQQAYQASARILSTARELFQTLIDVV